MKRPLVLFSIYIMAGITVAYVSRYYAFIALSIAFLFLLTIIFRSFYANALAIFIVALAFYTIGAVLFLHTDRANIERYRPVAGEPVTIIGFIDSEPDIRPSRVSYIVKTHEIISSGTSRQIKGKILLNTLPDPNGSVYEYGKAVIVKGQLEIPKSLRNPGGFNYRRYLAQSGISATIFSTPTGISMDAGLKGNPMVALGLSIKSRIIEINNNSLPAEQAGLLNGMLIGYRGGLGKTAQQTFSDAGLSHIMAVSGANVAFIVFPLVFLFKRLRFGQRAANLIIIGILVLFVFVTGFSPSVVRAVIMAVIILTSQIIKRESDIYTSIALSAILMLMYNPYTLFDIGFQLSYAATLSLVLFYKNIKALTQSVPVPGFIADAFAITFSAQLGVLPITAYYFNKISIISIVSNLLVAPLVGIITIIGFIMVVAGQISILLSQLIGCINNVFLTLVLLITKISAELPFAVLKTATPHLVFIIIYYLVVLFFLWYKPRFKPAAKPGYYIAAATAVLVAVSINIMLPRNMEAVFIDVGEGDSVLIKTHKGKTILIDGGGYGSYSKAESNIGETLVMPLLLDYGISKLDLVIGTHGHDDHIQGLYPVLKDFEVENFVIPDYRDKKEFQKLLEICYGRGIKVNACSKGNIIRLDDETYFEVLSPPEKYIDLDSSLNNTSLVLKLHYKKVSLLLTGDMEQDMETKLIEEAADLKADVLKIAHHGSDGSTQESFLSLVQPRAAVISVGKNSFGHPSKTVLERLAASSIPVFRTDEAGAVILISDGKSIKFKRTVTREK